MVPIPENSSQSTNFSKRVFNDARDRGEWFWKDFGVTSTTVVIITHTIHTPNTHKKNDHYYIYLTMISKSNTATKNNSKIKLLK